MSTGGVGQEFKLCAAGALTRRKSQSLAPSVRMAGLVRVLAGLAGRGCAREGAGER